MEGALEKELNELKNALRSLENGGNDFSDEEFMNVKETFETLIYLKTEELLNLKKQNLLSLLKDIDKNSFSNYSVCFRCHNGNIVTRNVTLIKHITETNCIIIFKNPIYNSELPCKYILSEEECPNKNECKFFHGIEVEFSELEDAVIDKVTEENENCLVQLEEGSVWRQATVLHINLEDNSVVAGLKVPIAQNSSNNVFSVNMDRVVKEMFVDMEETDDEEDEDGDDCIHCDSLETTSQTLNFDLKSECNDNFGAWEKHTRGIGIKLLLKMGYKIGQGLGVNDQGRHEPVIVQKNRKRKGRLRKKKQREIVKEEKVVDFNCKNSVKAAVLKNDMSMKTLEKKLEAAERNRTLFKGHSAHKNIIDAKITKLKQQINEGKSQEKLLSKSINKKNEKLKKVF